MEDLEYKPSFEISKRWIVSDDTPPPEVLGQTPDSDQPSMSLALQWASIHDEIDNKYSSIYNNIENGLADMSIPAGDVIDSTKYLFGHEYIDYTDYRKLNTVKSNLYSTISAKPEYDMLEMLWAEVKVRTAEWLIDKIDKIPVVGTELADRLKADVEYSRQNTMDGLVSNMRLDTVTMDDMSKSFTGKSMAALVHVDKIDRYLRDKVKDSKPYNFNVTAMELSPIVDGMNSTWRSSRGIINATYGINIFGADVDVTKYTPYKSGGMTEWLTTNGKEAVAPVIDTYKYIRERVLTQDVWTNAVSDHYKTLNGIESTLKNYVSGKDLACCLLDNVLGISSLSKGLKFLKYLKVALSFAFNGLSIGTDSLYNMLIDIFNQVVMIAMGKVITTLEAVLDKYMVGMRNYFNDFALRKGEAWRRCYPFDELMRFAINSLSSMENDLLAYISDYTSKLKLTHVNTNKYLIQLKEREYARNMLDVVNTLISGIHTGIVCKDLSDISREYTRPTPEELSNFINIYNERKDKSPDEGKNKYGRSTVTGEPIVGDYTDDDRKWLQDCDKSITDAELKDIYSGLLRVLGV